MICMFTGCWRWYWLVVSSHPNKKGQWDHPNHETGIEIEITVGGIRSKSGGTLAKIGDSTSTDQTYVSPFQWQVWGYTVAAIPAFQTHLFSIHVSPHWTLLEGGHLFWTVPHTRDLLLQWLQDHWSPKADLKIIFSGFLVSVFTWRSQINRKQKSTSK